MVGAAELAKCKKGVRLVNCARGGLYNEQAVADAIKSGQVASLGLDVLADEPKAISPLIDLPQCVLTPHLGADTLEAQDKVGIAIAKEVINALHGEMVPNAVNLPALHPQEMEGILKYLELGEALGKLYYQMEKAPVEKVGIVYEGDVANRETSLITRAVLKGIFEPVLKERINVVNAELATKSRGVEVVEGKNNDPDKASRLQVIIYAGKKSFTVAGTVLSNGLVRITEIDGYRFDLTPAHYMIVVRNEDKPGMIGQIGTFLGAAHVNIATMQVSRTQINATAMMFMTVDSEVEKETIKMIAGIDGITASYFVKL